MAKLTLKLGQVLQLESEINGFVNPQNGKEVFVGFRKHKLPLKTKYWLSELGDRLAAERKSIETLRDEIIQKHGEDDGKYTPLTMEDLDKVGETTDDYNLLFMLVQKPTE